MSIQIRESTSASPSGRCVHYLFEHFRSAKAASGTPCLFIVDESQLREISSAKALFSKLVISTQVVLHLAVPVSVYRHE